MENINAGMYCMGIGIVSATVVSIFLTLYTKWKKVDSYTLVSSQGEIVLTNNRFTTILASIRYFFFLSCFTFIVATNKQSIILQLAGIYLICLTLAAVNYIQRVKFKVTFDKMQKIVSLRSNNFSFENCEFIVESDRRYFIDDITSYGLYLVDHQKKYRLIYGYSIHRDISKLKKDLKALLNIG